MVITNKQCNLAIYTDTSMIAVINVDYVYEQLFSCQLHAQSLPDNVFKGIIFADKPLNVLRDFEKFKDLGGISVALCRLGGEFEGIRS